MLDTYVSMSNNVRGTPYGRDNQRVSRDTYAHPVTRTSRARVDTRGTRMDMLCPGDLFLMSRLEDSSHVTGRGQHV